MGFYGNIRNTTSNSFKFDRVYSNRAIMEQNADGDGVFGGRYVLVEYDQPLNENPSNIKTVYKIGNNDYYETIKIDTAYAKKSSSDTLSELSYYIILEDGFNNVKNKYWQEGKPTEVIHETKPTIAYRSATMDGNGDHLWVVVNWTGGQKTLYKKDAATGNIIEVQSYCSVKVDDVYAGGDDAYKYPVPYYKVGSLEDRWFLYDKNGDEIGMPWNAENIFETEQAYSVNYAVDKAVYGLGRGYDSTVWRKVYTEDGHAKYVNVAELNSVVPTFALSADSPSDVPRVPHFDKDSTNVYYNLHMQTPWGFMIADVDDLAFNVPNLNGKSDAQEISLVTSELDAQHQKREKTLKAYNGAIYFNLKGFSRDNTVYSGIDTGYNKIQIDDYQSGKKYNNEDDDSLTNFALKPYDDMKGLSIILPVVGDTVAEMWDTIYGVSDYDEATIDDFNNGTLCFEKLENQEKYVEYTGDEFKEGLYKQKDKRRTIHAWEDANDILTSHDEKCHLVHYIRDDGYTEYHQDEADSLVGTINSAHDLMGMIITEEKIPTTKIGNTDYADPQKAHTWQIYYVDEDSPALNEDGEAAEKGLEAGHYYYVSKSVSFEEIPYSTQEQDKDSIDKHLTVSDFKETYQSDNNSYNRIVKKVQKLPNNLYSNEVNGNIYRRVNGSGIATEGWKYYQLPSYLLYMGDINSIDKDGTYYKKITSRPSDYRGDETVEYYFNAYTGEEVVEDWRENHGEWYELVDRTSFTGYGLNSYWYWLKAGDNINPRENSSYINLGDIICSDGNTSLLAKYLNGQIRSAADLLREATNASRIGAISVNSSTVGQYINLENHYLHFIHKKEGSSASYIPTTDSERNPDKIYYIQQGTDFIEYIANPWPTENKPVIYEKYLDEDQSQDTMTWEFNHIPFRKIFFNDRKWYCKYNADEKDKYVKVTWPLYASSPIINPGASGEMTYYSYTERLVNLPDGECWYAICKDETTNPLNEWADNIDNGTQSSRIFDLSTITSANPIISFGKISLEEQGLEFNTISGKHSYWKILGSNNQNDIITNWGKEDGVGLTGFGLTGNERINNYYLQTLNVDGYYTEFTLYKKDGVDYIPADAPDFSVSQLPMYLYIPKNQYYIIDIDPSYEGKFDKYQKLNVEIIKNDSDITTYFSGANPKLKIGIKQDSKVFKELNGFAKNVNTLHGLLLKINEVLQTGNLRTHDNNTVQGCLNQLHDVLDKFEPLIPGELYGVNAYGKLAPVDLSSLDANSEAWITITPGFNDTTGKMTLSITHNDINKFSDTDNSDGHSASGLSGNAATYVNNLKSDLTAGAKVHDPYGFGKWTTKDYYEGNTDTSQINRKAILYSPAIDNAGHSVGEKEQELTLADLFLRSSWSTVTQYEAAHPVTAQTTEDNGGEYIEGYPLTTLNSPNGNVNIHTRESLWSALRKIASHINNGASNIVLSDYNDYYDNAPYFVTADNERNSNKTYYIKQGNTFVEYTVSPWPTENRPVIYEKYPDVDNNDNINEAIAKLQYLINYHKQNQLETVISTTPATGVISALIHDPSTGKITATKRSLNKVTLTLSEHDESQVLTKSILDGSVIDSSNLGTTLIRLQKQINAINDTTTDIQNDIINNYCGIIRSDKVPTSGTANSAEVHIDGLNSGWIWVNTDANGNIGYVYIKTREGYNSSITSNRITRNYWELLNAWQ